MMKRMIAAAILLGTAGQASAGGPVEPAPEPTVVVAEEPTPSFDWTGVYAGLSFGAGSFSDDGGVTTTSSDPLGIHLGYLHQFGSFVAGIEAAYAQGGLEDFPGVEWTSTRVKLIGGYAVGRFLPYAFIGGSRYAIDLPPMSDTTMIYGLGGKFAFGAQGRVAIGLEYLVEDKDDYASTGEDLRNREVSIRLEYRF